MIPMKNITDLCMLIARRERGKKEVNIAQIREIVGILSDLMFSAIYGARVIKMLIENGRRRFIKRMKKK